MVFRRIAALAAALVLSAASWCAHAGPYPIPHVGMVDVNGRIIDIVFKVDNFNVNSLEPEIENLEEVASGESILYLSKLFDKALDFNVTFSGTDFDPEFEVLAGGINDFIGSTYANRVFDILPVVAKDYSQKYNFSNPDSDWKFAVRHEDSGVKHSAILMRAEHLEPGRWYTVRLFLDSPVPDGTDVNVNIRPMRDEQGLYLTFPAFEDPQIDLFSFLLDTHSDFEAEIGEAPSDYDSIVAKENLQDGLSLLKDTVQAGVTNWSEIKPILQEDIFAHAFTWIVGSESDSWKPMDHVKLAGGTVLKLAKFGKDIVIGMTIGRVNRLNIMEHVAHPNGISHTFRPVSVNNGSGRSCWNMNGYDLGSPDACMSIGISPEDSFDPDEVRCAKDSCSDTSGGGEDSGNNTDSYSPTQCHLKHKHLKIFDTATGRQVDTGKRSVYPDSVLEIEKKFEMEGSDAEDCRIDEDLETVETGFWISVNGGSEQLIRDADGDRYQKTQMSNLDEGDDHKESVFHTLSDVVPGDKVTYVACHDVNNDLNQINRDDCEDEELWVVPIPIEGEHSSMACDLMEGEALDVDLPEGGLPIEVYINAQGGTPFTTIYTETQDNGSRSKHRWYWQIPREDQDGLVNTYYFKAKNHGPGEDRWLPWQNTGVAGRSFGCTPSQGTIVGLYRFYSSLFNSHFYTASENEKNDVANGNQGNHWGQESTEGWVFSVQEPGSVPVYRLWRNYNEKTGNIGGHFFTRNATERANLLTETFSHATSIPLEWRGQNRWANEDIGFYVYPTPRLGTVYIEQAWREATYSHFYTSKVANMNQAVANDGYTDRVNVFTSFPALPVPQPSLPTPTIAPLSQNVTVTVGSYSLADRIIDERDDFVVGEKIYAHVIGDANYPHQWKLRVLSGGSTVYEEVSEEISEDVRGDLTIDYEPTTAGTYTVEALVNMGNGWISKGLHLLSVEEAPEEAASSCSIVSNHSFEDGSWSDQSWGSSSRSITVSSDAYDGASSGHINVSSYSSGQVKMVSQSIPVTGGETYHLSLFVKGDATNAYVQPISYNSSGNAIGYGGWTGLAMTGNWQEETNTIVVPSDAQTLKIEIRAESSGNVYVDDIYLADEPRGAACDNGGNPGDGNDPQYDTDTGTLYVTEGLILNGSETNTTFSVGQTISVAPGIINGKSNTEWVYTELKKYTGSWSSLGNETPVTFTMPANSAYPENSSELASMSTSFGTAGTYIVQSCAVSTCRSQTITVQ